MRCRGAIAAEQALDVLAVREIETAAAGEQKFSAWRWHSIVDNDGSAAAREHLGRHQSGGAAADDGDMGERVGHLMPSVYSLWKARESSGASARSFMP